MGATYTRQSSYTDGDVITAAHTNDEFDQILAAFQASSGHTHDGTANEGGPITKLLGNSLTFGAATAGTDITITFDGETSDGVLAWMEDEDYFKFSDDILIVDDERLIFGTDENIAISYDETTTDSLKIAATEGAGLAITLMADEGDDAGDEWKLNIADGGTLTFGNDIASAGSYVTHLTLTPNSTVASSTLAVAGNLTVGGSFTLGSGAVLSEAELEMLDGITAGTVAASKAMVVDANKDIGTVRNLTIDGTFSDGNYTFDTSGNVSGLGTIGSGAITSSGNITSGNSFIIGSASINEAELETIDGVTAGTVSASKAVVVDSNKDVTGFRNITITGELDAATLDISGDVDVDGTLETDALSIDGTAVTASAADINLIDGITNGTVIASKAIITDSNKDITGGRNITISGELDAATLDISGDADIDGTLEADAITIAGVTLAETISDTVGAMVGSNTETGVAVSYDDSDNTLDFVLGTAQTTIESIKNTSLVIGRDDDNLIKFSTDNQIIFEVSGGDNVIFKASGEIEATSLDISGDADIDGTLEADAITVNGTALNTVIAGVTVTNATTAAVATTVTISDNESTNEENAVIFTAGGDVDGGNIGLESDGDLTYNPSTGTISATIFKGNIDAVDGDFDGTLEADAITVGGTALNTVIAGVTVTNATNSAHVLVTDNESTNEENLITFVEGATDSTGNVGLEMDGNLSYNPSTGTVSATIFKGNIDAVDGDFDGTLEADAITVAGATLSSVIQDEATALAIALG